MAAWTLIVTWNDKPWSGDDVHTNPYTIEPRTMSGRPERRATGRKRIGLPGRVIWHDSRGTPRFSSVVTRDVSEHAAYVECLSGPPIPLHRLVYLQIDRTMRGYDSLPTALREGRILSAVYRVGAVSNVTGLPDGYALRLLVEPRHQAMPSMPVVTCDPRPIAACDSREQLALPA